VTTEIRHRLQSGCCFIILDALGTGSNGCPEMSMKSRQLHEGLFTSAGGKLWPPALSLSGSEAQE